MTKQTGGVAAKVERLVRPVIEEMDLQLWDVRFEKEGPACFLRVFIDRSAPPMDTDTCERVSRAIDPLLDAANLIDQSYYLEVGSPGLGRKLTRDEHFSACLQQKVEAKLYRADALGRKTLTGVLRGKTGNEAQLETEEGIETIDMKSVGAWKLCDDEDLFI